MAYEPADNITSLSGLNHVSVTYYNKKAMDTLRKNFRMLPLGEPDIIPRRNGKVVQWFRYADFGANTTAATEGDVASGLTMQSTTLSATVVQYVDFLTFSDLLVDTAIDPIVENGADQLGYRLGLSVDTLVRTELESVNSSVDEDPVGSYLSAADFRRARALLAGADVKPKEGNYFMSVAHPYVVYDLVNDSTAGGFIDMYKYTRPENMETMQDRGLVGRVGGCEIWESTNVATGGSSPNTKYNVYVVGQGALGIVDLEGRGVVGLRNNVNATNMPIKVGSGGPEKSDPAGVIGAWCSFNIVFVAKLLRTAGNYRFIIIEADSSVAT